MIANNFVYLPPELITEILLRLPVKTLSRCRCVCKSWLSLISHDPNFATSHFQLASSNRLFLSLDLYSLPNEILSIDFDSSLNNDSSFVSLSLDIWDPNSSYIKIGGSCRGFLFLQFHTSFYLWNPSTGVHKQIPNSPMTIASNSQDYIRILYGFDYDPSTDDYSVVLGYFQRHTYSPVSIYLEVFSLRANNWKQIEVASRFPRFRFTFRDYSIVGSFLNGSIHWLACNYETNRIVIIAFQLKEMRMLEITLPDRFNSNLSHTDYDLFVFGGNISAWIVELKMHTVEIWVMQEYTVHSSWTKTLNFSFHPAPEFYPVCFTNCGDLVGTVPDGRLVKFNDKGELLECRFYGDYIVTLKVSIWWCTQNLCFHSPVALSKA